jgi:uncharacterized protein
MQNKNFSIKNWLKSVVPQKHRNSFLKSNRLIIKNWLRYIIHRQDVNKIISLLSQDKLKIALEKMPEIPLKLTRPYFLGNIEAKDRTEVLLKHYSYFIDNYNELFPKFYTSEGLIIGKLPIKSEEDAPEQESFITLKCDRTMRREAELTMSITDGVNRLYSIGFNIQNYKDSQDFAIFISNLQGPTKDVGDMQQLSRDLTKQCHGFQPRFLLINLTCMLAEAMDIKHILAVHTGSHVFQGKKYHDKLGTQIFADYDALWENFTPTEYDSNFVEIALEQRKSMEDIASKKRSMYRKRYAWCDELMNNLNNIFKKK